MDSIFHGDLSRRHGRTLAWADSLLVDHALLRLLWSNWAAVVPGRLYRCNHPTPQRLAAAARRFGLRSVINLRGATGNGSDALSREAAAKLGLQFIDAALGSRVAERGRILALCEALQRAPQPILVHCKSGADRAGFAAGLFLLLAGASSAEAASQLSWRFGHLRRSRTGILDAFFARYAEQGEGRVSFLDWLRDDYDEAALRRDFAAGRLASLVERRLLRRE